MSASRSHHEELETGGRKAPRPPFGRLVFRLLAVLLAIAAVAGLAVVLGQLPSDTSRPNLILRAAVGLGTGLMLLAIVWRMLGALAQPPPAPPERLDARAVDVVYECGVCGTRVRLEVAATGKAPRHCGEEMEAAVG